VPNLVVIGQSVAEILQFFNGRYIGFVWCPFGPHMKILCSETITELRTHCSVFETLNFNIHADEAGACDKIVILLDHRSINIKKLICSLVGNLAERAKQGLVLS